MPIDYSAEMKRDNWLALNVYFSRWFLGKSFSWLERLSWPNWTEVFIRKVDFFFFYILGAFLGAFKFLPSK
jgi:hypothetical protein